MGLWDLPRLPPIFTSTIVILVFVVFHLFPHLNLRPSTKSTTAHSIDSSSCKRCQRDIHKDFTFFVGLLCRFLLFPPSLVCLFFSCCLLLLHLMSPFLSSSSSLVVCSSQSLLASVQPNCFLSRMFKGTVNPPQLTDGHLPLRNVGEEVPPQFKKVKTKSEGTPNIRTRVWQVT